MRFYWILIFSILFSVVPAAANQNQAEIFGTRESVISISLSPDGQKIAYLAPTANRSTNLYVTKIGADAQPKSILLSDGAPWGLRWCAWASNTRLVCQLYAVIRTGGTILPFTRTIAINDDGSIVKQLGERSNSRSLWVNQFDGQIIGWNASDNNEILMGRNYVEEETISSHITPDQEGLGVDRIDTLTLKRTREIAPRANVSHYLADTDGKVRILSYVEHSSGLMTGKEVYYYRRAGEKEWRKFSENSEKEPGMIPVSVDATQNVAFAYGKKDGRDAIYKIALVEGLPAELLQEDSQVDVESLIRLGRTGRVIGVQMVREQREAIYFDPGYKSLALRLGKALPGLPQISFMGASRDENRLLLFAGSDVDPGRYYLYDKMSKQLQEIMLARPQLEHVKLAPMQAITYKAADGTNIPAYLTLPVDGPRTGLPAIVLPHGGPASRDEWGFDWMVQYFASQGFAVLQPNFRGSAGYGEGWFIENGFKSWRIAIGDVNDAGRWLVQQGIANPKYLGILGWSYGGYAALQSAALDPDLFKAIVAIAPVTDLQMLIEEARNYTYSALVYRYVGTGEHIISGSPVHHVASFKAPVLMFTGDHDLNVEMNHSKVMDKALREKGKQSELILYPGLSHSLHDSEVRKQMLERSSEFLKQSMGIR